ncbi:MAG TPA: hypothetical protein VFB29_06215 [Pseudolabrys sp.]|nr:hypothetical protein [Pseudolabrys sp.]
MLRRFLFAFFAFVGVIVPAAFVFAVLAAPPASPAPIQPPGCDRNLAEAATSVAAMQARVKALGSKEGRDICTATRLYFLEVVKARAVTALCKSGSERERELGRLDANVEHINEAIAARCS